MDKEIIELLKTLAGSAETLVVWYMVLNVVKDIVFWCGMCAAIFLFVRGLGMVARA